MNAKHRLICCIALVFLIGIKTYALHTFQIQNETTSGHSYPIITMNGQPVIEVRQKGSFNSMMERAQRIQSNLSDADNQQMDLSEVQIQENHGNYQGYVGSLKLFEISEDDTQGTTLTPKEMAEKWAVQIQQAAQPQPPIAASTAQPQKSWMETLPGKLVFPAFLGIGAPHSPFWNLLLWSILGLGIQFGFSILAVLWIRKRYPPEKTELLRLKRQLEITQKALQKLTQKVQNLESHTH